MTTQHSEETTLLDALKSGDKNVSYEVSARMPRMAGLLDLILSHYSRKLVLQQLEKHEAARLNTHLEEMARDKPIEITVDVKKLKSTAAVLEWIEGVLAVDPETHPIAAAKWHEALRNLLKGNRDMLLALERVTPDMIERYKEDKAFTLDDAIAFEAHGLGSVMPVDRISVSREGWAFGKDIMKIYGVAFLPLVLVLTIGNLFGILSGSLALIATAATAMTWFAMVRYWRGKDKNFLMQRVFTKTQNFWVSDLGLYTLNRVFGRNQHGFVFWKIHPVEDDRATAHIAATPDVSRSND